MRTIAAISTILAIATTRLGGDLFAGASAAAFQGMTPSDASSIEHNSYYLWNADPNSYHQVVADLGVSNATSMTVHVRGSTQGLSRNYSVCTINARGLSNASGTQGTGFGSTFGLPEGFFTMTVSISGLPANQSYAFELWCNLGPIASGHAAEQIWAWY